MTQRIRINTESVSAAGRQFAAEAGRLAEITGQLQGAIGSLDLSAWDGVSRSRAEPILGQVGEGQRVSGDVEALGRQLVQVARVFEERDRAAVRDVDGLAAAAWHGGHGGPLTGTPPRDDEPPRFDNVDGVEGVVYGPVPGRPFLPGAGDGGDIHPSDVTQGSIGDCYLLASLAAIAQQNPEAIRRMIRANEDGTYTVTLYQPHSPLAFWEPRFEPVEVTVTPDFPVRNGAPVFAHPGDAAGGEQELWPMLIEKAYAQSHGSYGAIEGGLGYDAMQRLTGTPSEWHLPQAVSFSDLADHFEAGHAITASSLPDLRLEVGQLRLDIPDFTTGNPLYQGHTLHGSHEYYVSGIDRAAQTISLRNPWGWHEPEITLTFEQFRRSFLQVSANPITP